ncbi:hypothetical protein AB4120_08025 [Cupriavidus sp. 2KB_3]|uniref:hypothetical protein n=1 Tax=Cupriavidus TaxID=106589 RepID=UPI0011EF2160|nr:hypothetical protein [Cupriavidus campinensis]
MIEESKIVDGIVIVNDRDPRESVVFNFRTWVAIIQAIMVKYGDLGDDQANAVLLASSLVENALDGYLDVGLRAHELDYHWAMLLTHGEQYWRRGIDSDPPEGFWAWEKQYKKEHNLEDKSFVFFRNS